MVTEIWKQALSWEGLYEVSNKGRVRSVSRVVKSKGNGLKTIPVTIRKPQINRYGYHVVGLNGKEKYVLKSIHRMVIEAFIGPIGVNLHVNHLDGNKTNNNLCNLEVCTQSENHLHRCRTLGIGRGENHGNSKLNEKQVLEIKELFKTNLTMVDIAKIYHVDRTTIGYIRSGKLWGYLNRQGP